MLREPPPAPERLRYPPPPQGAGSLVALIRLEALLWVLLRWMQRLCFLCVFLTLPRVFTHQSLLIYDCLEGKQENGRGKDAAAVWKRTEENGNGLKLP